MCDFRVCDSSVDGVQVSFSHCYGQYLHQRLFFWFGMNTPKKQTAIERILDVTSPFLDGLNDSRFIHRTIYLNMYLFLGVFSGKQHVCRWNVQPVSDQFLEEVPLRSNSSYLAESSDQLISCAVLDDPKQFSYHFLDLGKVYGWNWSWLALTLYPPLLKQFWEVWEDFTNHNRWQPHRWWLHEKPFCRTLDLCRSNETPIHQDTGHDHGTTLAL